MTRLMSHAELRRRTDRARTTPDLVEGLIPGVGLTVLAGQPMAGKTTLMAAISASVSSGQSFADLETGSGRVVWVYQDRDDVGLRTHLDRAARGVGKDLLEVDCWDRSTGKWIAEEDLAMELLGYLDEAGAVLVVLDCFRRVSDANETNSAEVSEALEWISRLCDGKRAVVLLHHSTKSGSSVRGSGDFAASAQSLLFVTARGTNSNEVIVDAQHHHGPSRKLEFVRDFGKDSLTYRPGGTMPGAPEHGGVQVRVLEALRDHGMLNLTGLKKHVQVGSATLNHVLSELLSRDEIHESKGARGAREFTLATSEPEQARTDSGSVHGTQPEEEVDLNDTPPPPSSPRAGPGPVSPPLKGGGDETGPPGTTTGPGTGWNESGEVAEKEEKEGCGAQNASRSLDRSAEFVEAFRTVLSSALNQSSRAPSAPADARAKPCPELELLLAAVREAEATIEGDITLADIEDALELQLDGQADDLRLRVDAYFYGASEELPEDEGFSA